MMARMRAEEGALQNRLKNVAHNTDEIMQLDSRPLQAENIISCLRKQFAFLSGGRGQDGSPIIIFPEFPAFNEIKEEEFQNVLTYLTSVPSLSAAGVGFILVIDRRNDKWSCVKGTLLRISGWFPGNLRLVLILRPSTLLQRTLCDVLFKVYRDEFKMKVPVVMLSSLTELHLYISRNQLTQELGGAQGYCHQTWISHRIDIEGFGVLVKTIAQNLLTFGRELDETELSNDTLAITNLLHSQTDKKDSMKEEIGCALQQGRRLLENIREPLRRDPNCSLNPDQLENLATVHRLLSQLNESSTVFNEFWQISQTKLEECLQLCQFENSHTEVSMELEQITDRLTAFPEVGMSLTHTEHLLHELTNQEEGAFEVLDRIRAFVAEGHVLLQSSHYAGDCIGEKCSKLQMAGDELSQKLRDKRTLLLQALELHQTLGRVLQWCDDGIYLLASQPLDKCQSQEGAESALEELESYLETATQNLLGDVSAVWRDYERVLSEELQAQVRRTHEKQASVQEMFEKRRISLKKLAAKQTRPVQPVAPTPEAIKLSLSSPTHGDHEMNGTNEYVEDIAIACTKVGSELEGQSGRHDSLSEKENLAVLRRHVMNELLDTEKAYVEELLCVLQGYAAEMDNPAMAPLIPSTLQKKKEVLFGNMQDIYCFHQSVFLKELETYTDCPELVGQCFLERMAELQIYEKYCQNKPRSESLWRQCSDCAFFQECQKKLEHKLGLDSYLLKPVQRITKYQLLLKEMIKYSKGCEGLVHLQAALSSILGILKAVNDSMHLIAITGYESNLGDLGRLLMQGSFSVWAEHKRGHVKVMELARFKPMQRHLFLHEKALLFCKRREESGEGYEKAPSYSFKQELSMTAIGITENAKGDNKKFEIWSRSRDEVYTIQAVSEEVKTVWVTELRKLLTGQLTAYKEVSQPKSTDSVLTSSHGPTRGQESRKTRDERSSEPSSPDEQRKPKRQDIKSDPTPLEIGAHLHVGGTRRFSTSSLFQNRRRGWVKGSISLDASVECDGYSSAENSEAEDEKEKTLFEELSECVEDQTVRSEDEVKVSKEGENEPQLE